MSLPRLTFLYHLSSSTSICQIPELCSPTNPMQPPISRWYNPDKRCDVMVGVLNHFKWTVSRIARIESESWWARDKWSQWRRVSLAILSPEHLQNDMLIESAWQNANIARKVDSRMVMNSQSYCFGILHFVLGSHLILQRNMPCFCLFVVLKSTDV